MSLQVSDLKLSADKLAQFADSLGAGGLQDICDGAAADVARLTAGYALDATSLINFGRAITLFRAYGLVGPVPQDIEKEYTNAWNELQSIARGDRPNLPKVADPAQNIIAGGYGGDTKIGGRMS
jgi:hypothetical protein